MRPSRTSGNDSMHWPRFGLLYRAVRRLILVIFPPIFQLLYGWRVCGQQNLQDIPAAVTLCNHVHTLDCIMMACAFKTKQMLFLSLPSNLKKPVAGFFVRLLGGVSVPSGPGSYRQFFRRLEPEFYAGRFLQVYPEGWLIPGCRELREFYPGAFQMAQRFDLPVIPCVLRPYRRRLGGRGLELCILPAEFADPSLGRREKALDLEQRARTAMQSALHSVPLQYPEC